MQSQRFKGETRKGVGQRSGKGTVEAQVQFCEIVELSQLRGYIAR